MRLTIGLFIVSLTVVLISHVTEAVKCFECNDCEGYFSYRNSEYCDTGPIGKCEKTVITSKKGERKVSRRCDPVGCVGNDISDWVSETFAGGSTESFCCNNKDYCNAANTQGVATGMVISCLVAVAGIFKLL